MPLVNPKLFGLNVKSNLADLQDSNAALSALNIPSTDLDIIRGSSNAGATIGDWISLSRLSKPIYKTLDRFYQETSIYSSTLSGKASVNFPLLGNLQINGRLSGKSIRYRYVDGSGSGAAIRFADISTSRVSAWSSTASPVVDTSPIFYGARVGIVTGGSLQFGTVVSQSVTTDVTNGLVLNLDAGNASSYPGSGTNWTDLSGNGNDGTLVGPTYNIGDGGSLAFDGNDYVSTPLISGTSFTWSVWFKTNVTANGYRNIISIPTPSYMLMLMDDDTNNMGFWASDTLTTGPSLNMGPITPNTWNYATFVREGNNIANGYKTYINGFFRGSANTGVWSSLSPIRLGGRSDANQFLNGNIAQVSIYNRALTAAEIQQNYNVRVSRFNLSPVNQLRLQTTSTPRTKEFDSEFPTHKINCTIGGQTVSLYAMKGIPVVFSGNFRNLTASITLSSLINGIPASWKVVDVDNPNIFVNYRNQGSNTSTINYNGRTQKPRFIEFYYSPNSISSINIRSANISTLPQSKFPNLTTLDLSFNSIRNFPDLNVISPLLRQLILINNPLYLNDNANRRRLNTEILSLIPTSLRQLTLGGTFFGSVDLNAIGDRFPQLQAFDLGRDSGAYFYPDSSNPSAPIPNVSDTCVFYNVRNNDFRTIGISSVTNANSKNVKDLTDLVSLDLTGNYNLTDATFSISASNIKIQTINIGGTGLPCPDLNGRQSLLVFNGNSCRNIGSITTPSGTYKFDGCNSLARLNFNDSPLTGPFPKFTNSNLDTLDLRSTRITGGTPEGDIEYVIPKETFSLCSNLSTLYISSPILLASPIHPNAFDSTVSLVNVSYNSSGITSGPLPSFSACRNLRNIYFSGNRFSGSVPNFAANPNITNVELSNNQFTGNVPAYRNLPLLREVNLFNNQIAGFPSKFTNLPALEFFRANNNQISGQIPDFSDCPRLFNLILFNNQFTSYFSGSFTLLYRIRLIDLSNNLLTQQAINLIIDDLLENYNTIKRGGVVVNLRGNTLPSATALEKITFLNSKGWSIVY